MRRILVLALAGPALAGCSSFSLPSTEAATPAAPPGRLELDSKPSGATATSSDGQSCSTPCALLLPVQAGLTVTFALDKHLPRTVALQVIQRPGPADYFGNAPLVSDLDPNPIFAELQPATPPRKAKKAAPKKPAAAAAATTPATTTTAAAPGSPFPPPPQMR